MDTVAETVRLPRASIHGIKQCRTVVLRNRVMPLHDLNGLLALDTPQRLNADDELAVRDQRMHIETLPDSHWRLFRMLSAMARSSGQVTFRFSRLKTPR